MFSKAILIFSLVSVAFATVFVTTPVASSVFSGGKPAQVTWMEDGNAPPLSTFGLSSISIYVGNKIQQTGLQVISAGLDVSTASSISYTVNADIGPDSSNYFIRFQSINGKDNVTGFPYEAFSAQFTLNQMTGTFNSSVLSEIAGQSTAPLGSQPSSGTTSPTSTPSLTTSTSTKPTSTSSTSATAKTTSGAMGLKAGWAGIVFGAVVGVTMF